MSEFINIRSQATQLSEKQVSHLDIDLVNSSGVVNKSGGHWAVSQASPLAMKVLVAVGRGYFLDNGMVYSGYSDANKEVTISANGSGNPRIDMIVAYVNKSATPNADASNVLTFVAVAGTPASSPVAPSDSAIQSAIGAGNPFIKLAQIAVASGASNITDANITDKRSALSWAYQSYGLNGWDALDAVLTFSSASGHNYTVNTNVDLTSVLSLGMKIQLNHASSVKYFIVHAITSSTLVLYGGQNYSLSAGAITLPYFSYHASPLGFPLEKEKWSETFNIGSGSQVGAVANSIYNVGGYVDLPLGAWNLFYKLKGSCYKASTNVASADLFLSDSASTESDTELTSSGGSQGASTSGTTYSFDTTFVAQKDVTFASLTNRRYINMRTNGSNTPNLGLTGGIIRLVNNYL